MVQDMPEVRNEEVVPGKRWFLKQRFGAGYRKNRPESGIKRSILLLSTEEKFRELINTRDVIAFSDKERGVLEKVAKDIIEDPFFDTLPQSDKANVLLFANWWKLEAQTKEKLEKEYGLPIHDDINIVPALYVGGTLREICGDMESRMLDSRQRVLVGKRLLLKLFGTDAAISDHMIVGKKGNILIPYIWYLPDNYFLNKLDERHQKNSGSSLTRTMKDFPLVGLQVLRHSPEFPEDEGWDSVKHPLTGGFTNLHDKEQGLTALIEKHRQEK